MLHIRASSVPWFLLFVHYVQCSSNLQSGFSELQRGHRLDGRLIISFPELSFLDCVIECLVRPRCVSVNYYKGANFCELNYDDKKKANANYTESPGWVYSEKDHWPKELAGICSDANCSLNEKCVHKKYTEEKSFKCVISDCGIPDRKAVVSTPARREDAIGVHRRMNTSCSEGYFQFGSGQMICQSNGEWKYDILCENETGWVQYKNHIYRKFPDKIDWDLAEKRCKSNEAYLVEFGSLEENIWVYDNIAKNNSAGSWGSVWIGGRKENPESVFIWSKSKNRVIFTHWSEGEPNNAGHKEDCIEMHVKKYGKWNDKQCKSENYFVCEKDIN